MSIRHYPGLRSGHTAILPGCEDFVEPLEIRKRAEWSPGSVSPAAQIGGELRVELPWPPSVNDYLGHRVVLHRGDAKDKLKCPCCQSRLSPLVLTYPRGPAKTFRQKALVCLKGAKSFTGKVSVEIVVYPPNLRRRDIDNLSKTILDAMTHGGVWEDDSHIERLVLDTAKDEDGNIIVVPGGKIDVRVTGMISTG